jgi:hypothetical protein
MMEWKSNANILCLCVYVTFSFEWIFLNKQVTFYAKAQLVIRDIFMCFDGRGHGNFFDIDEITVCADYQ